MRVIWSLHYLSRRIPKLQSCGYSSIPPLPILTLYTKENCSLCDDAVEVLKPHWDKFSFETVDITKDGNQDWYDKYRYDIPVFHFNGKFLMKHKVNEKVLLRKIQEYNDKFDKVKS